MTPAVVRAQLEEERSWRSDELRLLRNQLSSLASEAHREVYRRSLVVMLYAHFEGFCRNALAVYIQALNDKNLKVSEVNWNLAASALLDVFDRLHNKDVKSTIFKQSLPEDNKLHRYARDRDFLESVDEFESRAVALDADELTNTESNLKPAVMRMLLFRLGFNHKLADPWAGQLNLLLGRRNNIAHGASKAGVDQKDYADYERAAGAVMDALIEAIFRAVADEEYARPTSDLTA